MTTTLTPFEFVRRAGCEEVDIAVALINAGRIEEALYVTGNLADKPSLCFDLICIARAAAKVGYAKQAETILTRATSIAVAMEVRYPGGGSWPTLLTDCLLAMAELGWPKRALSMLANCADGRTPHLLLEKLAGRLPIITDGDADLLLQMVLAIRSLDDELDQASLLEQMARNMPAVGNLDVARELIERLARDSQEPMALLSVASVKAVFGDCNAAKALINRAVQLAKDLPQDMWKPIGYGVEKVQTRSACVLAQMGDIKEALQMAPDELDTIGCALVKAGNLTGAESILEQAGSITWAHAHLARALVHAGETQKADRLFSRMRELIEQTSDPHKKAAWLTNLAEALRSVGYSEQSRLLLHEMVELIERHWNNPSLYLTSVLRGFEPLETRGYEEIQPICESIGKHSSYSGPIMNRLVKLMIEREDFALAKCFLRGQQDYWFLIDALASATRGQFAQALQIAEAANERKGDILRAICRVLAMPKDGDSKRRMKTSFTETEQVWAWQILKMLERYV